MIGRTYLERGEPVVVRIKWGSGGGPRNVLIERADGTLVVRPFRGLRRPKANADNRLENLEVMNRLEHNRMHGLLVNGANRRRVTA